MKDKLSGEICGGTRVSLEVVQRPNRVCNPASLYTTGRSDSPAAYNKPEGCNFLLGRDSAFIALGAKMLSIFSSSLAAYGIFAPGPNLAFPAQVQSIPQWSVTKLTESLGDF